MFDNLLPPLNDHNLPYPDTIHPIVVHFVIAMVLFAFFCDVIGYFTRNSKLYEVSWWNMFNATIYIFIAIQSYLSSLNVSSGLVINDRLECGCTARLT